eukprot:TRINITY_DN19918_c0_g1_i1.p1 TRINITY_DN19918_c0_g1~~TRINITY_DN19918_c0_g1_i1.p1  ORF type:complete len:213 (+),score=40.40 TRINITY_DN19918_c0_g1_i1:57-641(+)
MAGSTHTEWAENTAVSDSEEDGQEFGFDHQKGVVWRGGGTDKEMKLKAKKQLKYTEADDLFDPDADDADAKWVQKTYMNRGIKKEKNKDQSELRCHLSCPCCFTTVTLNAACVYHLKDNIWLTEHPPLTCTVDSPIVAGTLPKKLVKASKSKNTTSTDEPEYYSIQCGVCQVRVGAFSVGSELCYYDCVVPSEG